jgi:hypothetical protein
MNCCSCSAIVFKFDRIYSFLSCTQALRCQGQSLLVKAFLSAVLTEVDLTQGFAGGAEGVTFKWTAEDNLM